MAGQILILAPRGRDAAVIEQVLRRDGSETAICAGLEELQASLSADCNGVLLTEEALEGEGLAEILDWIERQPPWSDLPIIVLATRQSGRRSASASSLIGRLGNVVLLERPINAEDARQCRAFGVPRKGAAISGTQPAPAAGRRCGRTPPVE